MDSAACPICAKVRGEGPLAGPAVWEGELVRVSHLPAGEQPVVLGHLIVETRRHAVYLDGLTDAEAAAVGLAARNAARALRSEFDVDYIHSAIINAGVEHFHQHVYVRHRGTPDGYQWHRADEWPDAPQGDAAGVAALSQRLAAYFPATVAR